MCWKKTRGFTLIELLVVIVLLGVVTSFAVLSMGTGSIEREMEEEAKRLHALIKLVQEEAIIKAKDIAMEVDQDKYKYTFLERGEKKWVQINNKIFKPREIKQGLELDVFIDKESSIVDKKENDLLRLYFFSSGEQMPFQMRINIENEMQPHYLLSGYFNGKLVLEYVK